MAEKCKCRNYGSACGGVAEENGYCKGCLLLCLRIGAPPPTVPHVGVEKRLALLEERVAKLEGKPDAS